MASISSPAPVSGAKTADWRKPFFLIWTGQAFSLLGSSVAQFALIWWLTRTTNSAVVLTTSTFVAMLPGVFLAPFAGALVDRWNRKRVMIVADSAIALATLALVFLFWSGSIQLWHIYVISFLRGLGGTFHWPAMQSSTSLMVPKEQLSRVQGINQALNGMLLIVAPPAGALLVNSWSMHQVMMIDVLTAAIAVGILSLIAIPQPVRDSSQVTLRLILGDIREGFRYVWHWRGVMLVIGMALLINFLLTPASVLIPLLVVRIFQGNAWHLGALNSAEAIGILVGGLLLGIWGGFKSRMVTSLSGVAALGIGAACMGLAPASAFGIAIAGIFIMGFCQPMANGPLHAVLQERIAPEMQGRVFTLIGAGATAMAPIGTLIAGPLSEGLGLRFWFLLAAVACLVMGIGARFVPDIIRLEEGSSYQKTSP